MMGNCEKMLLISSSSNQWPQNQQIIDHNQLNLMGSMDKPAITTEVASSGSGSGSGSDHHQKQQQKQPQEPLRCPRCDSSNTKFCYYNNYSLSQPRYFCKACKRYWTKGGTLRNVPVGGGCRKNNRRIIKRPNNSNMITNSSSSPDNSTTSSSSTTSCVNPIPILFGLPTNSSSDLNHLPFSGFDHLNSRGSLGFSPANIDHRGYNLNGFSNVNSSSLLSGYSSLFANPSSSSLTSLFGSKFTNGGGFKDIRSATAPTSSLFQNLAAPFDHHDQEFHVMGLNGENQVKLENGMKKLEWEAGSDHHHQQNIQTDQIGAQDHNDPNSLFNNWSSTWHDPTNLGSSIPSLI